MTPEDREIRRACLLAAMEEATGEGIAVDDPTADELIAAMERLGAPWPRLLGYVYTRPEAFEGYSVEGFERYHQAVQEAAAHVVR